MIDPLGKSVKHTSQAYPSLSLRIASVDKMGFYLVLGGFSGLCKYILTTWCQLLFSHIRQESQLFQNIISIISAPPDKQFINQTFYRFHVPSPFFISVPTYCPLL